MSSLERTPKKRCVIQKLDFENCVVTNVRTRSGVRKKARARITRKFEQTDLVRGESDSSDIIRATPPLEVSTTSPVLFKKKKPNVENEDKSAGESSSLTSPVFKLKMNKYTGVSKSQEMQKTVRRMTSLDLITEGNSSEQSCQIEDFTQESKQSVKISSVDSAEIRNKSSEYSLECKSDSSRVLNISWDKDGPDPLSKWLESKELNDSFEKVRKNYKENTLLGRLENLLLKEASEKLLWQHRSRGNSTCVSFVVVDVWREEFNFFLKCKSTEPEWDVTVLVVDSKWVPNVKKIQAGSVIQLYPPWQKISTAKPPVTVLLNVICLDVLEEIQETSRKNATLQSVPVDEFQTNPSLFINSLFSNSFSKLLI